MIDWKQRLADAVAAYNAMTPEQKAAHDYEQRRSWARGMCPSKQDYDEWCKVVDTVLPPQRGPAPTAIERTVANEEPMLIERAAEDKRAYFDGFKAAMEMAAKIADNYATNAERRAADHRQCGNEAATQAACDKQEAGLDIAARIREHAAVQQREREAMKKYYQDELRKRGLGQ